MLRIGFFVCLKNSSIIDDFWGWWCSFRENNEFREFSDKHSVVKFPKLFNLPKPSSQNMGIVFDTHILFFRLQHLFFRLQHDIRHNHLLHRDTAVLEGVTVVADMTISIVVIDKEIVVVGENIARREV